MQNFAEDLQKVRAMDTKDKFKKQLNNIESQYRDIFVKTLGRFHNDMIYAELPDKLHNIEEKLAGYTIYHNNQTINRVNLDIQRCRNCKTETLKRIEDTNELCCQNCGLLEKVEGAAFNYNENLSIWWLQSHQNKNGPTGNTTSNTSWKNMWRSVQHKALSCLLTQFNWLVSFSRKLNQTCHETFLLHLLLSRSFERLRKIMNGSF